MRLKYLRECFNIFVHSITVGFQLMCSFVRLSKLQMPVVSIFGGSKEGKDPKFSLMAYDLAQKFVKNDISIITGGGPGIMEAANCGAASVKKKGKPRTLGIAVSGVDAWFISDCYRELLKVSYFFMRKWLLIRYSVGFVVFPGGIGTMDELFDLLNLSKHHRIPEFPIVLIGKTYWQPLMDWFTESALKSEMIDKRLVDLFVVTDDINKAFDLVYAMCKKFKNY